MLQSELRAVKKMKLNFRTNKKITLTFVTFICSKYISLFRVHVCRINLT